MLMLDDTHPDIEEFVAIVEARQALEHANLFVCISDAFIGA